MTELPVIARTIGVGPPTPSWAKVIDHSRCIGCHACTTACKSENQVPLSVTRTYVESVEVGAFPQARRAFQVTRCNQCADAPCVAACPTSAMFVRADGTVDFDKQACIGCRRAWPRGGPGTGLRGGLPHPGDHGWRPERPGLRGRPTSSTASNSAAPPPSCRSPAAPTSPSSSERRLPCPNRSPPTRSSTPAT